MEHAKTFFDGDPRGGLVMTLMDVWVLQAEKIAELNACCWVPVDHEPAPPMVQDFFNKSGAVPLAMSRFGEELLSDYSPLYVPHGVDTDTYKPDDLIAALRDAQRLEGALQEAQAQRTRADDAEQWVALLEAERKQ